MPPPFASHNTRIYVAANLGANRVGEHFHGLATALADAGYDVLVLTNCRPHEIPPRERTPYAIQSWPSLRPVHLRDAIFLACLLWKQPPRLLIANFAAVNLMLTMGWLFRVPCRVCWYHTMQEQLIRDSPLPPWRQTWLRWRKSQVYKRATQIVANSAATQGDLCRWFHIAPKRVTVFPLALRLDSHAFPVPKTTGTRREEIFCAGRLDASKGQDLLLAAFATLPKSLRNGYHLALAGSGPLEMPLRQQAVELGIVDRCLFLGRLAPEEVRRRMYAAAVVVVPSRQEAFGLVNIEALSTGTPVIAAKIGGIPEIIQDGHNGFLFEPGNAHHLMTKLELFLTAPQEQQSRWSQQAQTSAIRFDFDQVIDQQVNFFTALLQPIVDR